MTPRPPDSGDCELCHEFAVPGSKWCVRHDEEIAAAWREESEAFDVPIVWVDPDDAR